MRQPLNFTTAEFWKSESNQLMLNPRLIESTRGIYAQAWTKFVEGRASALVGIATSGSSGDIGRMILLRKEALLASAAASNARFGATSADVWLRVLPVYHVGGLQIGARAFLAQSQVVETKLEKWNAEEFYRELTVSNATLLSLVPTQLFDLVRLAKRAPRSLRAIVVGGARLESNLQKAARALGWPALPSYGLTECGSQVATAFAPGDDPRLFPLAHVELRVDSEQRLQIRSASLLSAQVRFPLGQEMVFEDPKCDGWFSTEDRVKLETDGSMTMLGRSQDFVKIGGEGVMLSRLEEILERTKFALNYPHDAVVLAAADDRLGARLILLTDSDSESTRALVQAFDRQVMPFERVRAIHFLPALPRSALGKLLRVESLALLGLRPV